MSRRDNPFGLSGRARSNDEQPISYLMAQAGNPALISLAAGLVDPATLPVEATGELCAALLSDPVRARAALQYGTTPGLAPLRQAVLEHLAGLDGLSVEQMHASAEQIVLTSGSQQMLYLLAEALLDPGDIVVTGWPSYFVYTGLLRSLRAEVRCAALDERGLVPEALDALLSGLAGRGELERVKIVYVVSYHQNPTGITLAEDRRAALLEIVRRHSRHHRILLVEDAAYRELTYEGPVPPSIRRYDAAGETVALLGTFSKPFAPGLKTGYGLLPAALVEPVIHLKGSHDFGSANFCQHLLLGALREGHYARHVARLCRHYARKRDAMLQALQAELGPLGGTVRWTSPTGGLYVYLYLPAWLDTGRGGPLFERALAEGVLYVPGAYCYGPDPTQPVPRNEIRLSFGVADVPAIAEGVARLARAVRAILPTQGAQA